MKSFVVVLLIWTGAVAMPQSVTAGEWNRFSELPVWEDGSSEMSYYDAKDNIYGTPRKYTRIHMLNRQWMEPISGVKVAKGSPESVAVFKLNIAEEIPTENYDYRYLTTLFLRRPGLEPFKMAVSRQEWFGTTYKQLRWQNKKVTNRSFS